MADEAPKEAADPVGTSFLAIADILDALTQVQPAVAGPKVQEALATIRAQWTPTAETQPAHAEGASAKGRHHRHSAEG